MRILSSAILGLGLLATASVGCDAPSTPVHGTPDGVNHGAAPAKASATPDSSTFPVSGHLSGAGQGDTALGTGGPNLPAAGTSVDVMAMAADGSLTTVASAPVVDGTFNADVPAGSSPTQIFIIKAKDDVGAVVGSAVINGFLSGTFFKAYAIDVPMDTATSYKAEITNTIAQKGVPGIQNYLNVIDTFVNAENTDNLTVLSAFTSDGVNILSATSDAIIAGEDVIESTLKSVGIPLDISALQNAQVAVVSGIDGMITNGEGKVMTSSDNFFQGLEAATAKAAMPVDQAIFNAVVNGSGAMTHSMKQSNVSPDLQFATTKSAFTVQSQLTTRCLSRLFGQSGTSPATTTDAITTAASAFMAAVTSAGSVADLQTAQTDFANMLLSKNAPASGGATPSNGLLCCLVSDIAADIHAVCSAIESCVAPCLAKLTGVYASVSTSPTYDSASVGQALADFDKTTATPPSQMNGAMSSSDAGALMQAVGFVQKQVAL